MLLPMILSVQLYTHAASQEASIVSAPVLTSHEEHLAHERHLAYLHWRHESHEREIAARRYDRRSAVVTAHVHVSAALSGHLGCGGLEALWVASGGARSEEFIAAEIAMAESGGNQYATGPAGERGYWQIHPDHGSLSTYNAYGNARAAIVISGDGRSWGAWTTYTSGAYAGRC